MCSCDISGRDPYVLLSLLHSFACIVKSRSHKFDVGLAKQQIAPNGFADRVCGMKICVNVFRSPCNVSLYDELYGDGAFSAAINPL